MPAVSAGSVSAKHVVVTPKYVMATAKHSCSISSDYKYHTRFFIITTHKNMHGEH